MGFVLVVPLVLALALGAVRLGLWAVQVVTTHSVVFAAARAAARDPAGGDRALRALELARRELPPGTSLRATLRPQAVGDSVVVSADVPCEWGVWRFVARAEARVPVSGS